MDFFKAEPDKPDLIKVDDLKMKIGISGCLLYYFHVSFQGSPLTICLNLHAISETLVRKLLNCYT